MDELVGFLPSIIVVAIVGCESSMGKDGGNVSGDRY